MILHMDTNKLENQLVLQCAPLITGLRISNLLIIRRCYLQDLNHLLEGSCIRMRILYAESEKLTILLYHFNLLSSYMAVEKVREFLKMEGYEELDVEAILIKFTRRYHDYREGGREFPHELGLLLGYPFEDVEGYIRNDGKNFLYIGYWKVYANVPAKRDVFRMFEMATERLLGMRQRGISVQDIVISGPSMLACGAGQDHVWRTQKLHKIVSTRS